MKKLWNTVYKMVGGRYADGVFRILSVLICASIAAVLTMTIGIIGPWEIKEYLWPALLAGGYAGVAGYFGAIFFQMFGK